MSIKQSKKQSYLIALISILFSIIYVSGLTIIPDTLINQTVIKTTGSNLSINFTSALYAGFIISDNWIYVENLRACNLCKSYSINLTDRNTTLLGSQLIYTINYTTSYNYNKQTQFIPGTQAISNNIIATVLNFFALSPVLGTILGVCILIAGLVILVIYIRKLNRDKNEADTIYG